MNYYNDGCGYYHLYFVLYQISDKKKVKSRQSYNSRNSSAGDESSDLQDKVNYLMWLNNKLRMSLRNVHTLQQHKQQLTKQVCSTHTGYTE